MASITAYFTISLILYYSWFYKKYKHAFSTRTFVVIFTLAIPLVIFLGVSIHKILGISEEVDRLLNYIANFVVMGLGLVLIGIWLLLKFREKNPFWEEQFRPMLYTGITSIFVSIMLMLKMN